MRKTFILSITLLFLTAFAHQVSAQAPSCGTDVPYYKVDLRGSPDSTWYSPNHSRVGNCCDTKSPDRCTSFEITLDQNAVAVSFSIVSGAIPPGALFYQIDCGPQTQVGQYICVTGPGVHYLTFCKPGNNENIYAVTSIPRPIFPANTTVELGCSKVIKVLGLTETSTNWNSVYPGTRGQYNNLLSCTTCTAPVFTPTAAVPPYIDYEISGSPIASNCGLNLNFKDTVRVYILPRLEVSVSPNPATFCLSDDVTGVLLTATATGGDGAYTYKWRNSSHGIISTSATYFASTADVYSVEVSDGQTNTGVSCPSAIVYDTVRVATLPVVNAGPDQTICAQTTTVQLNGTAQNVQGVIWTGGAGTFSPSATVLNPVYTPTTAERNAGSLTLTLSSTNSHSCSNAHDQMVIFFNTPVIVTPVYTPIACYGGSTNITLNVSGGTSPYTYLWNSGSTASSVTAAVAGTYSVTVTDAKGCKGNASVTLTQPTQLTASATGSAQVSCYNGHDGSVTVTATGGTPAYQYSLNGGTAQSSNVFNNLAAGSYTVVVTDSKGCTATTNAVVIANPPQLTASATGSAQVSCYNGTDGSITVTATGGTGALSYSLNGGTAQSSNVFNNLAAGSYTVVVTDTKGCTATTNAVVIANPPQLTATASGSAQVSCYNGTDGSITVTATGGTGALSYSLNGGTAQSSNVFNNLAAGSYTVVVTDTKGCTATTNAVVIANPPQLTASATGSAQVSCHNSNDGSITVIATGGTGTLSYSLNGGTAQSSNVFNNLIAGSYTVVVTDTKGCTATTNAVVIANPPQLTASATGSAQVSCHNGIDGSITVTATGGTGALSYSLNGGTAQSSNVFNNLAAGSYTVVVTDTKACTATTNAVVIANPPQLAATATGSAQVSCYNSNDGSITVTASGGTGALSYSLNGGTAQSSNVFNNLIAGNYTVLVTDAKGCTVTTNVVVIANPPQLTATATGSAQVSCNNGNDGSVTVTATGGTGILSYSLNGGTAQSSNVFNNLAAGSYTVVVTDTKGCTATTNAVVIANPPLLTASAAGSAQVSCYNVNDGQITVTVTGGTGALSYSLNGNPPQASNVFTGLAAGNYTVMVTDSKGCTATTNAVLIINPKLLTASAEGSSQVSCYNATDGQISVIAAGGTGAYSFSLNGGAGQSSNVFTNLAAGSYTVVVTDANGCTAVSNAVVISNPAQLTASAQGSSQVSCHNASDGSITVTANGGTGALSYSISPVAAQSSNVFNNLPAGTYTIVVTDSKGCTVTTNAVVIDNPPLLTATAQGSSQVSCYNGNDGSITVTAAGGTGALSYSLNSGTAQSSNVFNNLPSGNYTIVVTDINGCTATTNAVSILNPALLTATAQGSSQVSCYNANDGSITVTAAGGTGALSYSLNGGPAQSSNVFNNLPSGNYTIVVSDINGCSATTNAVVITNPPLLTATAQGSSQVSCYNATDGSITVTAAGGTGALSYSLNGGPAQSSNVFNNLPSGNYTIVVSDINGCSATTNAVIIMNPPLLTATAQGSSQVSCYNATDGNITVTAAGGTGVLSYSLNGGLAQSSNVFANLPSGNYIIVVTDINGCSATTNAVIIMNPPLLTAGSEGSSQVSCHNASDGEIMVYASGGTGAYSYSLNGGPAQSSSVFTNLPAGTYIVVVSDINGCTAATQEMIIINPPQLTATAQGSSQVSCHNASDGSITVTASGGTGALSYSLNGGPAQSSNVFNGLSSGTYTVLVSDINGCTVLTNALVIYNPPQLTATAQGSSQVSCYNAQDGTLTVTATGGTGIYSYALNSGAPQSLNVFSGLAAGTYSVVVMDVNGCSAQTNAVVIANPPMLTAFAQASSQVSCNNASDGKINVAASGGTGAYSFSLNGGPAQASNLFDNLPAGTYTVVVTDSMGCSVTTNAVVIRNPELLTATAQGSSQVSCYNALDGTLTVTASGGTGAYSYVLNGGTPQASNVFNGLAAGTYTVVVTDLKNCTATTNAVVIVNPPQLTATAEVTASPLCFGANQGVIEISAAGGTGNYLYALNGGTPQSSNEFTGLFAGSYNVTVSDVNGCTYVISEIIITEPEPLTASAEVTNPIACYGDATGAITAYAAGGTGAYTYSLNGSPYQSSPIFTGLAAGTYMITVYDENGCTVNSHEIVLTQPDPISLYGLTVNDVTCYGSATGIIMTSAQGGSGTYTYSLNGNTQTSGYFTNLPAGAYSLTVTDANGCSFTYEDIVIGSPDSLYVEVVQSQTSCPTDAYNQITLSAHGGTEPYLYSVDGGETMSESNVFDHLKPGTYVITIQDGNRCTASTVFTVAPYDPIEVNAIIKYNDVCGAIAGAVVDISAIGGVPPYNYSINGDTPGLNFSFDLDPGTYTIAVYDNAGCRGDTTFVVDVKLPLKADLVSTTDADCSGTKSGSAVVEVFGGTQPYNFQWNNGEITNAINNVGAGSYTLSITDASGCLLKFPVQVAPAPGFGELVFHNVFSPNGDGINDQWVVDNLIYYPDNSLSIINRWGNEVYTQKSYQNDWNGSDLLEGTYFYVLKVNMCGEDKTYNGYITIVR
jgi:gliding motility-associated-like protein